MGKLCNGQIMQAEPGVDDEEARINRTRDIPGVEGGRF
jgi:hypothetical protein